MASASMEPPSSNQDALKLPPLSTPTSFPFPYARPYDIQLDLMRTVFDAIENGKIAIVESPTGTGKSLSLLTSTLSWLEANSRRLEEHSKAELIKKLTEENQNDPPWVIQHALRTHLATLQHASTVLRARLVAARAAERKRAKDRAREGGRGFKRVKVDIQEGSRSCPGPSASSSALDRVGKGKKGSLDDDGDDDEDGFLPLEIGQGGSTNGGAIGRNGEEDNFSPEVRALMAKFHPKQSTEDPDADADEPQTPKIFYTSRTHTQLRQLSAELGKTVFARGRVRSTSSEGPNAVGGANGSRLDGMSVTNKGTSSALGVRKRGSERVEIGIESDNGGNDAVEEDILPVRAVPLGGRRQLCINEKIRDVGKAKGDERMNEACLDLQKSDSKKGRCPHLPPKEREQDMLDFRDSILATPRDIEDVVELGKERNVCPYYATRKSVKQAELVTLPYSLLLQKTAREALGIDVKDQVIVIDEAHNLIDTLLSIHSLNVPLARFRTAQTQLTVYLDRFRKRLKPAHALHVKQMSVVLSGIIAACESWASGQAKGSKQKEQLFKTNDLVRMMMESGTGADQVNLVALIAYLKESQLARKVSGYTEKLAIKVAEKAGQSTSARSQAQSAISAFHLVENFLLSLTDANEDGRIILALEATKGPGGELQQCVMLKYMLLNPAEHFKVVVEQARCVILAGGTMEPISDFLIQLFPSIPRECFSLLSCAHVIPKSNLLTQVVCRGPSKREMEFKFDSRGDTALLLELGALVSSLINLIPDGVVMFLPSYSFLAGLKDIWTRNGIITKLDARKKIFYEPQSSADVDGVLTEYSAAINEPRAVGSRKTGALLLAVVGAKLSEGINFSDALGRCVIMVGLPFANAGSTELKERMSYVDGMAGAPKNAGRELYENLCMRAVNQSIGRAIRHQDDYATLLLVDKRYSTPRISNKLPKWIGQDVRSGDFPDAVRAVAGFFKEKKRAA